MTSTPTQFRDHRREYRDLRYVYPVISRRSKGLSIGLNLNPDKICNWDCPYCQVDRETPPTVTEVSEDELLSELRQITADALDPVAGVLWQQPRFEGTPDELRTIRDYALAGDGEPTSYQNFAGVIAALIELKQELGAADVPINILTNASLFHLPRVQQGLELLTDVPSAIWCKLDAGTEIYFQQVNRSKFSLEHCLKNTLWLAKLRPVTIQSMQMRLDGALPSEAEIDAWVGRLRWLVDEGGQLELIQVYTVARVPSEERCGSLSRDEVDWLVARVRDALPDVPCEGYYGPE